MKDEIIIASGNQGKIKEAQEILAEYKIIPIKEGIIFLIISLSCFNNSILKSTTSYLSISVINDLK